LAGPGGLDEVLQVGGWSAGAAHGGVEGFGQVGYPFHCHLPHRSFEALCRAPWPIFGWLGEASGS